MTLNEAQKATLSTFATMIEGRYMERRVCVHILQTDQGTGSVLVKIEFDATTSLPLWVGVKGYLRTETGTRLLNNGGKLPKRKVQIGREEILA